MSKVLVVGATGLLGRTVSKALESRELDVHRAARQIEETSTSHRLDLRDPSAITQTLDMIEPDVVVQLTGGTADDPIRLMEMNVVPTVNLISAAARLEKPPAIFVSGSAAEYGDPGDGPASEDRTPRPLSAYGWAKVAETATAQDLGRVLDVDLTVLRPFNPVMPDLPASTALGNFRHQILTGEGRTRSIVCGRTDIVRDFVSATFLGDAVADLVLRPPGGIVNICSGIGVKLADVFKATARLLDVELELNEDPDLAAIPAPDSIVGDARRLHSLIGARSETTPDTIALALLGFDGPAQNHQLLAGE